VFAHRTHRTIARRRHVPSPSGGEVHSLRRIDGRFQSRSERS
jgi:hypothetical protein